MIFVPFIDRAKKSYIEKELYTVYTYLICFHLNFRLMLGSRRASNSPSTQVNKNNVSDPTEVRVSLINNAELGDMSDDSDEQEALKDRITLV